MRHEEYAAIPGVNWSTLRELGRSPLHYQWRLTTPREDTPAMRLGRAVHCAVLEPDEFADRYRVFLGTRRGNAWTEFVEQAGEREILIATEHERCLAIRDAVRAHPVAAKLLARGDAEYTLQWNEAETGVACKARLDWVTGRGLVDLKTTKSVDAREFAMSAARLGYHGQLAFYQMGLRALRGEVSDPPRIIAVESEPPHDVAVFAFDSDALWAGDDLVHELLAALIECRRTDTWPGRYAKTETLSLPAWALPELSDEIEVLS